MYTITFSPYNIQNYITSPAPPLIKKTKNFIFDITVGDFWIDVPSAKLNTEYNQKKEDII